MKGAKLNDLNAMTWAEIYRSDADDSSKTLK